LDYYKKQPYAYFSVARTGSYAPGDCPLVPNGPYKTSTGFINPATFQIISAGADGAFGAGGAVLPGGADANGQDDLANFSAPSVLAAYGN
jgi:hypothetical protein